MRFVALPVLMLFVSFTVVAQKQQQAVLDRMHQFHELMISDLFYIDLYIDDSLSYGHSNGWVENAKEFYANLGSKMVYHSIKEDSIRVIVNDRTATIRFVADIDVSMDGKRNTFHLKVMEVWVKKRQWKLFARQAVK